MEKLLDLQFLLESFPAIFGRLHVTLSIAVGSLIFALIIGFVTALIRVYKIPILNALVIFYVSVTRGTPLLVQLYLVFYGLPKIIYFFQANYNQLQWIDINVIPPEVYALLAFSINLGAYFTEIFRSAIESVDKGQHEAAKAIGMNFTQRMFIIILPQSLSIAIPNLGNMFIATLKDTSLVFIIGVVDIMGQAKILGSRGLAFFEVYIDTAIIYWIVCIAFERILVLLERKYRKH